MTLNYITESIDNKIRANSKIVIYTFYELKWEENLTEEDKKYFIQMAKIRLENLGYDVYLTGDNYWEDNELKTVEINNELIAIKKEDKENDKKRKQDIETKYTKIKHTRRNNKKPRK